MAQSIGYYLGWQYRSDDGYFYCELCGDICCGRRHHARYHRNWERFRASNAEPLTCEQWSKLLNRGVARMLHGTNDDEISSGAVIYVFGAYNRSLREAIGLGYWMEHPPFLAYLRAFLDDDLLCNPTAEALLRSEHANVEYPGGRCDGVGIWGPARTRRKQGVVHRVYGACPDAACGIELGVSLAFGVNGPLSCLSCLALERRAPLPHDARRILDGVCMSHSAPEAA